MRKRKQDSPPLLECSHQSSDCSPEFSNKFVTICGGWEWSGHLNAAVKLRWWRWEEERRRRRRSWRCFFFLALLWLTILLYSHDHLNDQEDDDYDPDFSLVFNAVVQMVMLQEHRRCFLFLALCFDNHHRCNQIYHHMKMLKMTLKNAKPSSMYWMYSAAPSSLPLPSMSPVLWLRRIAACSLFNISPLNLC